MSDNGMLNAAFLNRCRKIGYRSLQDVLPFVKDPETPMLNGNGELIPYMYLSYTEQENTIIQSLHEIFPISFGCYHLPGSEIRKRIQILLDNETDFANWTQHLEVGSANLSDPNAYVHHFYFKNENDAVQFRLTCS